MAIWKDLEAQGVKRCCAMFTSGKRCRRRASAQFEGEWCAKHGPVMKRAIAQAMHALKAQARADETEDDA